MILKVARADALYAAVGISVTILELAIIATNPHLGKYALELSLVFQLSVGAIIDYLSGSLAYKIGARQAVYLGFLCKLFAGAFFGVALLFASFAGLYLAWFFLLLMFIFDDIGSGFLKTSFKPAYNQWHVQTTGTPVNFLAIMKYYRSLRLMLPPLVLLTAGLVMGVFPGLFGVEVVVVIILALRLVQVIFSRKDLAVNDLGSSPGRPSFTLFPRIKLTRENGLSLLFYAYGNLIELLVLMYGIGVLYQMSTAFSIPVIYSWLGSSLIALCVYMLTSFYGVVIISRFSLFFESPLAKILMCGAVIGISLLFYLANGDLYKYVSLSLVCLVFSCVGATFIRLYATRIVSVYAGESSVAAFTYAELITNIALVAFVLIGMRYVSDGQVMQVILFLVAALSIIYVLLLMIMKEEHMGE